MKQKFKANLFILLVLIIFSFNSIGTADEFDRLPVKDPQKKGYIEVPDIEETAYIRYIENYYTLKQIYDSIKDGETGGLFLDLTKIRRVLHGGSIDPDKIFGRTYIGPYPMESDEITYAYKRFRKSGSISKGKGSLYLRGFFRPTINSENWTDKGQVIIRVDLKLDRAGEDLSLGTYDVIVRFKIIDGKFYKVPTVIEGPMVNMVRSETPDSVVISFKTNEPVIGGVILIKDMSKAIRFEDKKPGVKHEIKLSGLKPATSYKYRIDAGGYLSRSYTFKSAPKAGEGKVVFSYSADSRAGVGSGDTNYLGVNYRTMERLANLAYQKGSEFFIFGGDMINGNTSSVDDFRTQIHGWKQAMAGFWNHRPVYTCVGNHESLIKIFKNKNIYGRLQLLKMDRWPYETESAEAVFADEFTYPENGPRVSDTRRPSYKENVYSFQYGPMKFIAFNNNYWVAKTRSPYGIVPPLFGGSPEGYIMKDQMDWIKKELDEAEKDPNVKYIILFAQEPVFPNGGHVKDCMWYYGNNNVRAFYTDPKTGKLKDEGKGMIDIRNEFVRLVGSNKKVAAVLGADEHAFHKILIDKNVPVGDMLKDDKDHDGKIDKIASPLSDLKYPVWYLVSGGGGAPYYAEEPAPWNNYWKKNMNKYNKKEHTSMRGCYYYSSQENIIMFTADKNKISAVILNPYGDTIDKIENLMEVKKIN